MRDTAAMIVATVLTVVAVSVAKALLGQPLTIAFALGLAVGYYGAMLAVRLDRRREEHDNDTVHYDMVFMPNQDAPVWRRRA